MSGDDGKGFVNDTKGIYQGEDMKGPIKLMI